MNPMQSPNAGVGKNLYFKHDKKYEICFDPKTNTWTRWFLDNGEKDKEISIDTALHHFHNCDCLFQPESMTAIYQYALKQHPL